MSALFSINFSPVFARNKYTKAFLYLDPPTFVHLSGGHFWCLFAPGWPFCVGLASLGTYHHLHVWLHA